MPQDKKKSLSTPSIWVQLYFVLASLLGLIMIMIGSVQLINTGLEMTLLQQTSSRPAPPRPYVETATIDTDLEALSEEDRELLNQWKEDYRQWQQAESTIDYQAESHKRQIANSVAILIVGIPVFAIHFPTVFRQGKKLVE